MAMCYGIDNTAAVITDQLFGGYEPRLIQSSTCIAHDVHVCGRVLPGTPIRREGMLFMMVTRVTESDALRHIAVAACWPPGNIEPDVGGCEPPGQHRLYGRRRHRGVLRIAFHSRR